MKNSLFTVGVLLMGWVTAGQAASVVVIRANDSDFGRQYFCGFSSLATERISAFQYEPKKTNALFKQVKKLAPDLVFTIGEIPIKRLAENLPSTPLIVSDYHASDAAHKANVVLMESDLPIGVGLKLAKILLPKSKTLGTVYNPKISQTSFDVLVQETGALDLRLASLKVDAPQDVESFISAFDGKIDLFYWLHDSTTSVDPALSAIYRFAKGRNVPVIALDAAHVDRGALLVVSIDPLKLGEQAWKTANVILREKKIPQMPVQIKPGQLEVSVSLEGTNRLGISTNELKAFLEKGTQLGYSMRVAP